MAETKSNGQTIADETTSTGSSVPVDKREIRGINFSLIRATMITIISIVASISVTYYNLKSGQTNVENSITEMRLMLENSNKITDLKLKTIENEIARQGVEIEALKQRMDRIGK